MASTYFYIPAGSLIVTPNNYGNPNLIAVSVLGQSTITYYAGLGGASTEVTQPDNTSYPVWTFVPYNVLLSDNLLYNLYAKCSKTGTIAYIYFSPTQKNLTTEPDFYYIPIGSVTAVVNNIRTFIPDFGELNTDKNGALSQGTSDLINMFTLNKPDERDDTTWFIEVLRQLKSLKVKESVEIGENLTVTGIGTFSGIKLNEKEINDFILSTDETTTEFTDSQVMTALRTKNELNSILDKCLRKDIPDTAAELITFLKGLSAEDVAKLNKGATFGNYTEGPFGSGAKITEHGAAEMRSLRLWEFLEVPELRYNRVIVNVGDKWNAPGGGIIKEVDIANKIITLKLEDGEIGAVGVDDICKGTFHSLNLAENATSNSDDSRGNTTFAGFVTCYFRITEILDTSNNSRFSYELRPVSANYPVQHNPSAFMNFVSYANFTNKDRQTSSYETRTYKRSLRNMNGWEISQANIASQSDDLSNLSVHGLNMTGYSAYLNNIYMSGTIQQFTLQEPLRMEINNSLGGLIAEGETMTFTASAWKGWVDISSYATSWKWTRDSGDSVEDEAWNNRHSADTTSCSVTFNDLPINSTLFTVTATFLEGTEVVTATKTFTI